MIPLALLTVVPLTAFAYFHGLPHETLDNYQVRRNNALALALLFSGVIWLLTGNWKLGVSLFAISLAIWWLSA